MVGTGYRCSVVFLIKFSQLLCVYACVRLLTNYLKTYNLTNEHFGEVLPP